MRHARLALLALVLAATAHADGMFLGKGGTRSAAVSSAAQKAVIVHREGRETLLLQTTYAGPAADFAWVIPVPALPGRDDVFPASAGGISAALKATQPRVFTVLVDPFEGNAGDAPTGAPPPPPAAPGAPGAAPAEAVTVHERFQMGQYEVAVLSATGGGSLYAWLQHNAFPLPRGAAAVLDEYLRRHWYFVALRLKPPGGTSTGSRVVVQDVSPVGITFPSTKPVYPLRISAISAPEMTSLILVCFAPTGLQPAELPVLEPPRQRDLPAGTTYSALVRDLLQRRQGHALLREYCGDASVFESLWLSAPRPPDRDLDDLRGLVATRLVGLLPRAAMTDLTLLPGGEPVSVRVTRTARVPGTVLIEIAARPWLSGLLVAVLGLLLLRRPLPPEREPMPQRRPWQRAAAKTLALYVLALLGVVALVVSAGELSLYDSESFDRGVTGVVLTLGALLVTITLLSLPVERIAGAVGLGVLMALGLVTVLRSHGASGLMVTVAALAGLAGGILTAATLAARPRRAVLVAGLVLMALGPLPRAMLAPGVTVRHFRVQRQLDEQVQALRERILWFRDSYGAYPASLSDLTAARPERGQDASGNPVRLSAGAAAPEPLPKLPRDPLTRRRDTWVYDPLSPDLVDSGAYQVSVKAEAPAPDAFPPPPPPPETHSAAKRPSS